MSAREEWEAWRRQRELTLTEPHGWLSPTGFAWLGSEPAPVEGLPGRWWQDGLQAHLDAGPGDGLTGADGPLDGRVSAAVDEAGSLEWVWDGHRLVELVRRGGRYAVRVRDPRARTRVEFTGVPVWDYDERWVRPGRFHEYPHAKEVPVSTARDDLTQTAVVVGEVEVELVDGRARLAATQGPGQGLTLLFHDETNASLSSPWRVVSTTVPGSDGAVVVDFNRATNLPFAFTVNGTCPAPVPGNRLALAVTAGEQRPA